MEKAGIIKTGREKEREREEKEERLLKERKSEWVT